MATTKEYIDYVCESIKDLSLGIITNKKMFGEYMVYINAKPILLVCDNTVYIKMKEEIKDYMENTDTASPYKGAKEHYILDVENHDLARAVLPILENITEVPKSRKKENKKC